MKTTYAIILALALLAPMGSAAAAATTAADPCSATKDPVGCGVWAVTCIGDALGGNACHEAAATTSASGPVDCVKSAARAILQGVTPMPCAVASEADADTILDKVVDCAARAVRAIVDGVTPMPCSISVGAAGPDVDAVVECTKGAVRDIVAGITPEPCAV